MEMTASSVHQTPTYVGPG